MDTKFLLIVTIIAFSIVGVVAQAPQSSPDLAKSNEIASGNTPGGSSDLIEGTVVDIEDGDTFSVQTTDNVIHQVRFQAVDAPEIRQPYYVKSKKGLAELILKKTVRIAVLAKDSNGRLIGTVFLDDRDVGLTQLEKGLAWYYKRYAYDQTSAARKAYANAQTEAASKRKGLWEGKSPIPPWIFRGELSTTYAPSATQAVSSAGQLPQSGERKYYLGPRGGCYYLNDSGAKVYVKDKSRCNVSQPEAKESEKP